MALPKESLDRLHQLRSEFEESHDRYTVALRRFLDSPDVSAGALSALNEAIRSHLQASEAWREAYGRAPGQDPRRPPPRHPVRGTP